VSEIQIYAEGNIFSARFSCCKLKAAKKNSFFSPRFVDFRTCLRPGLCLTHFWAPETNYGKHFMNQLIYDNSSHKLSCISPRSGLVHPARKRK
jgi:hypothetical protein